MTDGRGKYDGNALSKLTDQQVFDAVLAHFTTAYQANPNAIRFNQHGVIAHLLEEYGGRESGDAGRQGTWLQQDNSEDVAVAREDGRKVHAALWGLISRGLVVPNFYMVGGDGAFRREERLYLTERGRRFFSEKVGQAPIGSTFVDAFRGRCPTPPNPDTDLDNVIARVEDAVTCLDHHVHRAAVVMVGLAFEATIAKSIAALATLALIPAAKAKKVLAGPNAVDRIAALSHAVERWVDTSERHKLRLTVSIADAVRERRNDAAHEPAASFDHAGTDELIRCAAHHIPVLWNLVIYP